MLINRKIYAVLVDTENNPEGWLYLPNSSNNWNLETIGIFVNDEFSEEEEQTQELLDNGWIETLEAAMIEDVVYNAKEQKEDATPDELLEAFIYYFENDAFKEF
ncbi:DUF7716 domain-containing protein [Sphingobacterium bovistauri]|uniref:DUF7716 domain-containing protein n=1 Tax=Sphingobacterium bovistauri TaxID=2781959 RepID=A0ABS7Z4X4_9SPHI|nr:hypothetical protein [Sphingobacterium bovistauri]MCA5005241.1 hypothetical protein [Sphingobacterium bovistauri]